jgi:hypothetical protein
MRAISTDEKAVGPKGKPDTAWDVTGTDGPR